MKSIQFLVHWIEVHFYLNMVGFLNFIDMTVGVRLLPIRNYIKKRLDVIEITND